MDLSHGGHLTHGAPVSYMGKIFNFVRYKTLPPRGDIDYDAVRETREESEAEDRAVRTLVLSARARLRALSRDRRRGRRVDDGRRLARRRTDRRRRARESARRRLRHRHHDHAQVAARSARRHDPVQVEARAEDRPGRVPGPAGRSAHERGRRHRGDAEARRAAGVPRLREAGARERAARSRRNCSSAAARSSPAAPTIT